MFSARVALKAAMERARLEAGEVDEVILGHVLTAGLGQNPARQAAIAAGIPDSKTAFAINQVCGSGLRAVALAAQQIRTGESTIVIAGGQESMSLAPHAAYLRAGQKMGDLADGRHHDEGRADRRLPGLRHGGDGGERRQKHYQITREQQDLFADQLAEEGVRRAEGRPVQGRDRSR